MRADVSRAGTVNWDGLSHSQWVGVENVLVEVVLPGGQFGTPSLLPNHVLDAATVRTALEAASP
jgi:hypothetical protein